MKNNLCRSLRQSLYSRMHITSKTVHDINKMEDNMTPLCFHIPGYNLPCGISTLARRFAPPARGQIMSLVIEHILPVHAGTQRTLHLRGNGQILKESKLSCFHDIVTTNQFDVIALTETWLDSSISNHELPRGYVVHRRDRQDKLGGGVLLAINDTTRKYMHAETLALLTKPLYFPNMKYLK